MAANKPAIMLSLDDGSDLTDKVNPRLIALTLTEKRSEAADRLELTLHNHDRAIEPPSVGALLTLSIGWASGTDVAVGMVTKGAFKVDEVERGGPPDIITVRARSADLASDYKRRRTAIWKETTLGAILSAIAARNGLTPRIHGDLAGRAVTVIEQANKSDMAFVRDLGRRYDAVAGPKAGALIFMPIGAATTAGGAPLPRIALTRQSGWAWSFRHAARDEQDGAEADWQDQASGRRQRVTGGGSGNGRGRRKLKRVYASEAEAQAAIAGDATKRRRGAFTLDYDLALGDPAIIPNARVSLTGWDSQIDALGWLVDEVTHKLDASGLNTTVKLESV